MEKLIVILVISMELDWTNMGCQYIFKLVYINSVFSIISSVFCIAVLILEDNC